MRLFHRTESRFFRHATLFSFAAAVSLTAPGGAIMAMMPAAGPNLEGRWVEAEASAAKTGIERIGTIDIMSCGDGMCGVQVSAAGACGAVVGRFGPARLRPTKAADSFDALYRGTLQWRGRKNEAMISLTRDGLRLTAQPNALAASLSRSVMPSYTGSFVRAGDAKCFAPVS